MGSSFNFQVCFKKWKIFRISLVYLYLTWCTTSYLYKAVLKNFLDRKSPLRAGTFGWEWKLTFAPILVYSDWYLRISRIAWMVRLWILRENAKHWRLGISEGGEGVCYVCGCHFSNSSFQCKTDLFDAEGLLLELSKGNVRVEIPASFLFKR